MTDATGDTPSDAADAASSDAGLWRDEMRALVTGVNLVVLVLCIAVGLWGVFDGMSDADHDRAWGNAAVAAPGVYAAWCVIELCWRRNLHLGRVLLRIVSGCLVAPALVAVPIAVVQALAVAFPGVRRIITDATEANGGFHYWWDEGIGSQLILVPVAGYALGISIALGAVLIVQMPVLSVRQPKVMAGGSHLEKVDVRFRDNATAHVFCGLGALVLGITLWVFGDGDSLLDAPDALGDLLGAWTRYGVFWWEDAVWLFGVLFVIVGVALLAFGCGRVIFARRNAARG